MPVLQENQPNVPKSYFTRRVAEARRVVQEPPQPKVKLRMPAKTPEPPKITLKFGGQRQQGPSGVSVDSEALRRQQDLVNAGAHGRVPLTGNCTSSPKSWHDLKAHTLL